MIHPHVYKYEFLPELQRCSKSVGCIVINEFMLDGAGLQPRNTALAAGGLEVAGSTLARAISDSTWHRGVVQQLLLPDTVLGVDCQ